MDEIKKALGGGSLKRVFGGNLIFELGTFYKLKVKPPEKTPHPGDRRLDLYDIWYVFDILLAFEKVQWRINRFKPRTSLYVNLSQ